MRAWFMGKHPREKILLLVLLLAGAVLWSRDVSDRVRASVRDVNLTSNKLDVQARWLADRERIEAEARAAVEDLDSSRTYNGVRLSAEISNLAKQAGIDTNLRSNAAGTDQTAQFSVHSVELTLNRVPWDNLLRFYDSLSAKAPYISIDRFSLASVRSDTNLMDARLVVSSVEINRL